jgi:hypothetical protein
MNEEKKSSHTLKQTKKKTQWTDPHISLLSPAGWGIYKDIFVNGGGGEWRYSKWVDGGGGEGSSIMA